MNTKGKARKGSMSHSMSKRNSGGKARTVAKSMGGHGNSPGHMGEVNVMGMDGGGVTKRDKYDCC